MISQSKSLYISPQNDLADEEVSPIKHEYRQGQIYAMSGAKKAHIIIASNCNYLPPLCQLSTSAKKMLN